MPRNPARPLIQGLTTLKPQLMQTLSFYCFQSLCWLQVQSAGVRLVTFRHEHKTWNEWKSTSSSQGKCRCGRLASTYSVTSRSREFFILFDGIGTSIEQYWYRKSLATGLEKIWYRKKSQNRSLNNLVPKNSRKKNWFDNFSINLPSFLISIILSIIPSNHR